MSAAGLVLPCPFLRTDCIPSCAERYFESLPCSATLDRECTPCHSTCLTCTGTSALVCTACIPGHQFVPVPGASAGVRQCVPHDRCTYSDWTDWSTCSLTCGGGTQLRSRQNLNEWPCYDEEPTNGRQACNTAFCGTLVGRHSRFLPLALAVHLRPVLLLLCCDSPAVFANFAVVTEPHLCQHHRRDSVQPNAARRKRAGGPQERHVLC